jgi:hypothetical protein
MAAWPATTSNGGDAAAAADADSSGRAPASRTATTGLADDVAHGTEAASVSRSVVVSTLRLHLLSPTAKTELTSRKAKAATMNGPPERVTRLLGAETRLDTDASDPEGIEATPPGDAGRGARDDRATTGGIGADTWGGD